METKTIEAIGMVWYKAETYDACMRIMEDRAKLHTLYHLWRMDAETGEKRLRRQGKTVVRAFINPETFSDWCQTRGLNIDAKARNQFAAETARQYVINGYHNDTIN